jgi:hypothetical protein
MFQPVSPKKLPVVNLEGEAYFFDSRLSQLRNVSQPHKFLDLSRDQVKDFVEALLYFEVIEQRHDGHRASEEQR